MNIPTIGGTRGIFEIFIPGVFLLVNIGGAFYLLPYTDQATKDSLLTAISNPVLGLIIIICFGYLLGILLRLFRMEIPDNLSAWWLKTFSRKARVGKGQYKLYATEDFPYIGWMEQVCKEYLPPEAMQFYKKEWVNRKRDGRNKQFFNFSKILIASCDERAASEVYAAEALTRYIAGMFYALSMAILLIGLALVWNFSLTGQVSSGPVIILGFYFLAILVIIQNFRRIRIKEVEVVFSASLLTVKTLEKKIAQRGKNE